MRLPAQRSGDSHGLEGRSHAEHLTELRCCLTLGEKYQEVIAELDQAIAAQLRTMRRQNELPPKPRVRGRKPHDPCFDVRQALYLLLSLDLTAIEGIDEVHALTLVSELGTDFSKWPTVKHFELAGVMSQLEEDGRQGAGAPDAARQEPCSQRLALGSLEPDA